jgi:hypothetical protein
MFWQPCQKDGPTMRWPNSRFAWKCSKAARPATDDSIFFRSMLTFVMVLAFQNSVAFANAGNQAPPTIRIYVTPPTIDDALAPFSKPPVKCVPHPSKPMTEQQK